MERSQQTKEHSRSTFDGENSADPGAQQIHIWWRELSEPRSTADPHLMERTQRTKEHSRSTFGGENSADPGAQQIHIWQLHMSPFVTTKLFAFKNTYVIAIPHLCAINHLQISFPTFYQLPCFYYIHWVNTGWCCPTILCSLPALVFSSVCIAILRVVKFYEPLNL